MNHDGIMASIIGSLPGIHIWPSEGYRAPQVARPVDDDVPIVIQKSAVVAKVQPSKSRSKIAEQQIVALLTRLVGRQLSCAEIAKRLGRTQTLVAKALVVLNREGRVRRVRGAGTKTRPFLYVAAWRVVVARDTKTGVETTFNARADMIAAGFKVSHVEKCLRGQRETHNGCMFRYVDE